MTPEEREIAGLQADLVLVRQDVRGVEEVFDALGIPHYTPAMDLLRPTGRARSLLTTYRRLYVTANEIAEYYATVSSEDDRRFLRILFGDRLDRLSETLKSIPEPEAP